jgi:ATP-dependent DNA ligase
MRLSRRAEPFDSDLFIYELKIDGFRALAHIQYTWMAEHLRVESAVLDGEICCLDEEGRPNLSRSDFQETAMYLHRV